ncbi:MAG: deoxyribodipyrimidine photo-lyase [Spirochaetales bacterium]|nr:deoxyribodipyrimidine photo-lyase [Spirochaetales bacterium]
MKKYRLSLFIFRRDLRLQDNTALLYALRNSQKTIAGFIFDPVQIDDNPYKSANALAFMIHSLKELSETISGKGGRLRFYFGDPRAIVERIIKTDRIEAVCVNKDYTPFSRSRDKKMEELCNRTGVSFLSFGDLLLNEPEACLKDSGRPYTVFTPFFNRARILPVPKPIPLDHGCIADTRGIGEVMETDYDKISDYHNPLRYPAGGIKEAKKFLQGIKKLTNYKEERDIPFLKATTGLSAHIKFGTVSIREVYHGISSVLGHGHPLIRQLYWRDFFTSIAYFFPHVFGQAFQAKFRNLTWKKDGKKWQAFISGHTGFPIVDAGIRQLNTTGFMHNRVRMICASFLVKDLRMDWRLGERYFATCLTDYDPSINNGNWQWAASTGCDAQPYFRIFNPWLQQKKYDPRAEYIKTWVPELKILDAGQIHKLHQTAHSSETGYPVPIVDHALEGKKTKALYKDHLFNYGDH